MMMVATRLQKKGIRFAAVHDSFWTHPCDVDEMNREIRECFVELHSYPILEELDANFRLALGKKAGTLPPLPPKAGLDLERVRDSKYFFD